MTGKWGERCDSAFVAIQGRRMLAAPVSALGQSLPLSSLYRASTYNLIFAMGSSMLHGSSCKAPELERYFSLSSVAVFSLVLNDFGKA